jgi:PAS domain S-box-containing protein
MQASLINDNRAQETDADTRFSEWLANDSDAILITDLSGKIIRVNERAEEFFLLDRNLLCQTTAQKLICGFTDAAYEHAIQSLKDQKPILLDAVCLRSDQTGFFAEVTLQRIHLTPTAPLCFSIRDVTESKETERKLTEATEALLRAENLKLQPNPLTPFAHEVNNPLPNDIPAGSPVPPRSRRILIADDEIVLRQLFSAILHAKFPDFEIDLATNGKEALEVFAQRHHQVLLLDLAMPVMNGEESFFHLRRICQEKAWDMPSVIFCTGFAPPETVLAVVRTEHLHCYQPKPISPETLVNVVRDCLEIQKLRENRNLMANESDRNA